jgi:phosphatidate phosphatase APP1
MSKKLAIKVYHGFGHTHDIVLYGHVFRKHPPIYHHYYNSHFRNMLRLLQLFFVKPVPNVPVQFKWQDQVVDAKTEYDGFFRAEWTSTKETEAGWHDIKVRVPGEEQIGEGKIYIPHSTQYAFISDIDDTIMVSYSATVWKRMKELLFKNARSRIIFPSVAKHYEMLAKSNTIPGEPNPFFYVSSSEWNLYDYLRDVFQTNDLPNGAFLLNQVKQWFELWKTGKTKHSGKLLRVLRIMEVFPIQKFVLFGDNTQADPEIYAKLTEKYANRIHAIYIRNVHEPHAVKTQELMNILGKKGIHALQFKHSDEAIAHSKAIGLIR